MQIVGGKPIWLGAALVADYSRPGDLICDPCCGAGTFAVAAIRAGRRAVVGDVSQAHAELAARWIADPYKKAPQLNGKAGDEESGQVDMFAGAK
jgi:DNA modification methylase